MFRGLLDKLTDPKFAIRLHVIALLIWLIPGTVVTVFWLSNSVVWVSWMSLYAIVVSHWSAYQGSAAEERIKQKECE